MVKYNLRIQDCNILLFHSYFMLLLIRKHIPIYNRDIGCIAFQELKALREIIIYYNVPAMKGFYVNGQKYHPKAGYSPKAGDLIFINHLEENSNTPTHIGIVYSAPSSPSVVWIVDGNWGDKVCYRQLSLNDTSIVGYASPGYVNSSHTPTIWAGNDLYHWKNCYNCGSRRTENESHTPVSTWLSDHSYHWHVCSICGLGQIGNASHNIIEDPGTGWKACSVCGFDGPPYN